MSPRPRRLKRAKRTGHPRRATARSAAPIPNPPETLLGAVAIKAGIGAFALGAALALHEGHGDPPPAQPESPSPTGRTAIQFFVSATNSSSSIVTHHPIAWNLPAGGFHMK